MSLCRKGQSSLEYSLLIMAVIAGLVGIRYYVRYIAQGRLNEARWQILGGAAPYYGTQDTVHQYLLESNEQVTATPVENRNARDVEGNPGVQWDTQYDAHSTFSECEAKNWICQ